MAAILGAAALLRLWRLDTIPPGLQFDEAHNAIDAARVVAGARDLFFTDNGGREPLNIYLQALALAALGRDHTLLAIRVVSAAAGLLTIALLGGFVADLFGDRRLGRLAAAYLAVSYWHLHFSRYAIRAIFAPLWTIAAVWLWWRATSPLLLTPSPFGMGEGEDTGGRQVIADDRRSRSVGNLGHWRYAAACGLCLAGAVYSHPTGRLVPAILVLHGMYRAWADPAARRRVVTGLGIAGSAAVVACLPLGWWFAGHPGAFFAHPADVSIFAVAARDYGGSVAQALAHNAGALLGMLFVRGDPSTFHNLTVMTADRGTVGLAVFDPLTALLALFGIGIAVAALAGGEGGEGRDPGRRERAVLLAAWLGVMLTPTLLSDRPPNYSRAIAALPVIVLLPALGLRWAVAALDVRWSRPAVDGAAGAPIALGMSAGARAALIAGALAAAGAWTAYHYFVVFAQRTPHIYDSYDVDKQDAYRALVDLAAGHVATDGAARIDVAAGAGDGGVASDVFLHPLWAEHATIAYLNADGPIRGLDATVGLVLPEDGRDVVVAFPAKEAEREGWADAFAERFGSASIRRDIPDAFGAPLLTTFRVPFAARGDMRAPTDAPLEPATWIDARFGDVIELVGYTIGSARSDGTPSDRTSSADERPVLAQPGAPLPITLVWRSVAPTARSWTTFVHLVGPAGEPLGQADREPVAASYRTSDWRVGDIVVDRFEPVVADGARGAVTIEVGWYDVGSGERLPVAGSGAAGGDGSAVRLGPVAVEVVTSVARSKAIP